MLIIAGLSTTPKLGRSSNFWTSPFDLDVEALATKGALAWRSYGSALEPGSTKALERPKQRQPATIQTAGVLVAEFAGSPEAQCHTPRNHPNRDVGAAI